MGSSQSAADQQFQLYGEKFSAACQKTERQRLPIISRLESATLKAGTAALKTTMPPLPNPRPRQLSLGPLETEILQILWELGSATVKEIHDRILTDPDRELAYASVTTVLQRLTQKGWLACDRADRAFRWRPLVSLEEAKILQAHERLQHFLAVSNPDVVAAFADALDGASADKLEAIAQRLKAARQEKEQP